MKLIMVIIFSLSLTSFAQTQTLKDSVQLSNYVDCMGYAQTVTLDIHQTIDNAQIVQNDEKIHVKEIKSEMGKVYSAVLTACMLSLKPKLLN